MTRRPGLPLLLDRWARSAAAGWRRTTIAVLLLLAGFGIVATLAAGALKDTYDVPGSDSQAAYDLLAERFPEASGDSATVVFAVPSGSLLDQPRRTAIAAVLAEVTRQPGVAGVLSPLQPGGEGQVSGDGKVAFAEVAYTARADELGREPTRLLEAATESLAGTGVEVSLRGAVVDVAKQPPVVSAGELIGIGVAVVALTVVLGSVAGMAVTLLVAFVSLGVALGLIALAARVVDVPTTAVTLAVMLGLGVGIDYGLLITARHRENLAAADGPGHADAGTVAASAARANRTAGVAVVAAAAIVIVAISALVVVGIPFVGTMGVAAAASVAVVATGAVLLVPLGLGAVGGRLAPRRGRRSTALPLFTRWAHRLTRRPVAPAVAAVAALLVLASPAISLRLGTPDDGVRDRDQTQRVAYDRVSAAFGPGMNGPLIIAAALPAERRAGRAALDRLSRAAAADPGVAAVGTPQVNAAGDTALLPIVPASPPQSHDTSELLDRLRTELIPAAVGDSGIRVHVGGVTATNDDISDRIGERLPLFIGIVVLLAILLLAAAFRSILVPLVSAVFNLLSVFAAYGLVVLVFQQGVGNEFLGLDDTVPIVSFLPLFMFALLFGLSMDYNVFQQSRIREAYRSGAVAGDARAAVVAGVAHTGAVIAAAGVIMVGVFGSFVLSSDVTIKMIAFGLAVAILIDVLLVRFLLAPAVMSMLGDRAWRLPAWLDRILPGVTLEGIDESPPEQPLPVRQDSTDKARA